MAGGSADAAATIVAIDALYSLGMSREEMAEIAARLGSDVPFMLSGGTAIGRGHGDQLTSALSRGTYHWVLALSTVDFQHLPSMVNAIACVLVYKLANLKQMKH